MRFNIRLGALIAVTAIGLWCGLQAEASIPSEKDCAAVQSSVDELTADDRAQLKEKKLTHTQFADRLMEYVANELRRPAKFLLLREAFAEYALDKSFERVHEIYPQVRQEEGLEFAVEIARKTKLKLMPSVLNKDARAKAFSTRLAEDEKSLQELRKCKARLKKTPDDPTLLRKLGFECLICGDVRTALESFAATTGELSKVSAWELLETKTDDYSADKVAKIWWQLADLCAKRPALRDALRAHAAVWYRAALDEGAYSGNEVVLVEKRIAESEDAEEDLVVGGLRPQARDDVVFIVKGSPDGGDEWNYSFSEPEMPREKWLAPNLSGWKSEKGVAAFFSNGGRWRDRGLVERTSWPGGERCLWLRKEVMLGFDPRRCSKILLSVAVDDDALIWVNGKELFRQGGCPYMQDISCEMGLFKRGRNVIAAAVVNSGGPGCFDMSLKAVFGRGKDVLACPDDVESVDKSDKRVTLIRTSKQGGSRWRYSFEQPEMDLDKWASGRAGKWNAKVGVLRRGDWNGHPERLWMQSEFELEQEPRAYRRAVLRAAWDDNLKVWINGKPIVNRGYSGGGWFEFDCDRKFLRKGANTISVFIVNEFGNGHIDLGLEAEPEGGRR